MVAFHSEDIDFKPPHPRRLSQWISQVIASEGYSTGHINFVYCSKAYMLQLNQSYLQHTHHTDVITFDLGDKPNTVSADVFIGVEQVKENATLYKTAFDRELKRVMVHGILHLLGYNDKTPQEQREMRKKEEAYLSL